MIYQKHVNIGSLLQTQLELDNANPLEICPTLKTTNSSVLRKIPLYMKTIIMLLGNVAQTIVQLKQLIQKQIREALKLKTSGVLAPRSAHARPSTRPPIYRVSMCLQSHLQISLPTPKKSYPKFRNPRTTFENTPLCPPKYSIVRGVWGFPDLL